MTITTGGVITPETPAEQISYGWMVLENARKAAVTSPPESGGARIARLMDDLDFALDLADCLERDLIHPASEYPELAGEPEDKWLAMQRIAEEVQEWAGEVLRLFPGAAVVAEGGEAA